MLTDKDALGNALTVADRASVDAVNGFVLGFLGYEPRILDILPAAQHDDSVIVQACAAALHLFAESPSGLPGAQAHLARAAASSVPASSRERAFARAVQAWCDGDMVLALRIHDELAASDPRDLASIKLGQYHRFNLGDSPGMLRLGLAGARAAPDVPQAHGMVAFGYEQCHLLAQAEQSARRALAMTPREPWSQHALAHVMLTQGRLQEGRDFMQAVSAGWSGLTSFMRTHNWWHLAVFLLELGQSADALDLYDSQVWGVDKTYSQDQVGAVSLLARLELAGVSVGDRWSDLAGHLATRVHDQVQPFLDMQYLYGLARAARLEADALMAQIDAFAPRAPQASRDAWQKVCVPASRGLLAHARGDWAPAAQWLGVAVPRLTEIGGSHAQRDLFEQVWIDALIRTGQLRSAQHLLQPQLNGSPSSQRLRRRLAPVYAGLGLPDPNAAAPQRA